MMNYFELYQIPFSFLPNKILVKEKYFELSRKYHPDFFSGETENDQNEALEKSSFVNKAYKTFTNLDLTIKYILEVKGLIEEEEKYQLPNNFLMEMMELNENLMDAKMEEDELKTIVIKKSIHTIQEDLYKEVETLLATENIDLLKESDFLLIKDYYFKKKYLNRILESIKS